MNLSWKMLSSEVANHLQNEKKSVLDRALSASVLYICLLVSSCIKNLGRLWLAYIRTAEMHHTFPWVCDGIAPMAQGLQI